MLAIIGRGMLSGYGPRDAEWKKASSWLGSEALLNCLGKEESAFEDRSRRGENALGRRR